jgi:hypothetical protein
MNAPPGFVLVSASQRMFCFQLIGRDFNLGSLDPVIRACNF